MGSFEEVLKGWKLILQKNAYTYKFLAVTRNCNRELFHLYFKKIRSTDFTIFPIKNVRLEVTTIYKHILKFFLNIGLIGLES